jgi:hypothetical protein
MRSDHDVFAAQQHVLAQEHSQLIFGGRRGQESLFLGN